MTLSANHTRKGSKTNANPTPKKAAEFINNPRRVSFADTKTVRLFNNYHSSSNGSASVKDFKDDLELPDLQAVTTTSSRFRLSPSLVPLNLGNSNTKNKSKDVQVLLKEKAVERSKESKKVNFSENEVSPTCQSSTTSTIFVNSSPPEPKDPTHKQSREIDSSDTNNLINKNSQKSLKQPENKKTSGRKKISPVSNNSPQTPVSQLTKSGRNNQPSTLVSSPKSKETSILLEKIKMSPLTRTSKEKNELDFNNNKYQTSPKETSKDITPKNNTPINIDSSNLEKNNYKSMPNTPQNRIPSKITKLKSEMSVSSFSKDDKMVTPSSKRKDSPNKIITNFSWSEMNRRNKNRFKIDKFLDIIGIQFIPRFSSSELRTPKLSKINGRREMIINNLINTTKVETFKILLDDISQKNSALEEKILEKKKDLQNFDSITINEYETGDIDTKKKIEKEMLKTKKNGTDIAFNTYYNKRIQGLINSLSKTKKSLEQFTKEKQAIAEHIINHKKNIQLIVEQINEKEKEIESLKTKASQTVNCIKQNLDNQKQEKIELSRNLISVEQQINEYTSKVSLLKLAVDEKVEPLKEKHKTLQKLQDFIHNGGLCNQTTHELHNNLIYTKPVSIKKESAQIKIDNEIMICFSCNKSGKKTGFENFKISSNKRYLNCMFSHIIKYLNSKDPSCNSNEILIFSTNLYSKIQCTIKQLVHLQKTYPTNIKIQSNENPKFPILSFNLRYISQIRIKLYVNIYMPFFDLYCNTSSNKSLIKHEVVAYVIYGQNINQTEIENTVNSVLNEKLPYLKIIQMWDAVVKLLECCQDSNKNLI